MMRSAIFSLAVCVYVGFLVSSNCASGALFEAGWLEPNIHKFSPDGTKAVVRQALDLWIHDLQRGTRSRVTSPANTSMNLPMWSRDGTRIIFASNRGGDWDIYSQSADGSTPADQVEVPYPFNSAEELLRHYSAGLIGTSACMSARAARVPRAYPVRSIDCAKTV